MQSQGRGSARTPLAHIKQATVAIAVMRGVRGPTRETPYEIVGSGFCVHQRGVVITCRHVFESFMEKTVAEQLASIPDDEKSKPIQNIGAGRLIQPFALFQFPGPAPHQIVVACVGLELLVTRTDLDIGVARLSRHDAFPDGFPTVEIEDFENVHEGMDIGTCGFPLGNALFQQLGTVTSSFTQGIISSVIPAAGIPRANVKAFQLDLRATHGNSGGPVFSKATGKVFGILQGGVPDQYGQFLFSRAESIYPVIDTEMIGQVVKAQQPS